MPLSLYSARIGTKLRLCGYKFLIGCICYGVVGLIVNWGIENETFVKGETELSPMVLSKNIIIENSSISIYKPPILNIEETLRTEMFKHFIEVKLFLHSPIWRNGFIMMGNRLVVERRYHICRWSPAHSSIKMVRWGFASIFKLDNKFPQVCGYIEMFLTYFNPSTFVEPHFIGLPLHNSGLICHCLPLALHGYGLRPHGIQLSLQSNQLVRVAKLGCLEFLLHGYALAIESAPFPPINPAIENKTEQTEKVNFVMIFFAESLFAFGGAVAWGRWRRNERRYISLIVALACIAAFIGLLLSI